MQVYKITTGYVIQVYDTKNKCFVSQAFIEGDDIHWETTDGFPIDEPEGAPNLSFNMAQPYVEA
jgi:hypothetical protein